MFRLGEAIILPLNNQIKFEILCLQPKVSYFNSAVEKMEDACRRKSVYSLIHSRSIYEALIVVNFVPGDKDVQINMMERERVDWNEQSKCSPQNICHPFQ